MALFWEPVILYFIKNGRQRKTAKDSAQGHGRKGKIRTWTFLGLGPRFGSQETVTFERCFWCQNYLQQIIIKGINLKGGSKRSQGIHAPRGKKTKS